jgi:hypothetical protein
MATKTVIPVLALAMAFGAGCGTGGGQPERRLGPDTAAGLAARAEQVAAALDAGQCDQALAGAQSLQTDIAALPVDPDLRAEALARTARLVAGISCPAAAAPTDTTTATTPTTTTNPTAKAPKGKGHKGHGDDD